MIKQPVNESPEQPWKLIGRVFNQLRYAGGDESYALGNDYPVLRKQSPNLVGLSRSRFDESLSHPMQRQNRLLLDIFDGNKAHCRARNGLADRLRISDVVLVALTYGLTNCGAIKRTVCPRACSLRAQ
jgi:hypothetical protein